MKQNYAGIFTSDSVRTKTKSIGSAWSLKRFHEDTACLCGFTDSCGCTIVQPPIPEPMYRRTPKSYSHSPMPELLFTILLHGQPKFNYSFFTKHKHDVLNELDRLNVKFYERRARQLYMGDTREIGYYIDEASDFDMKWNAKAISEHRTFVQHQMDVKA